MDWNFSSPFCVQKIKRRMKGNVLNGNVASFRACLNMILLFVIHYKNIWPNWNNSFVLFFCVCLVLLFYFGFKKCCCHCCCLEIPIRPYSSWIRIKRKAEKKGSCIIMWRNWNVKNMYLFDEMKGEKKFLENKNCIIIVQWGFLFVSYWLNSISHHDQRWKWFLNEKGC